MKDFVRTLEEYTAANSYEFRYGRADFLNLANGHLVLDPDKIYFFMESSPRKPELNSNGLRINTYLFTGNLYIAKAANFDHHYFNEQGNDPTQSRYTLNIEPMIPISEALINSLTCDGFDIVSWSIIDVINLFDRNNDGVLVQYQVRKFAN